MLRRDRSAHEHFTAPGPLPVVGALLCAFFVGPWTGRNAIQYRIAGWLLAVGVVLWVLTWLASLVTRGPGDPRAGAGPARAARRGRPDAGAAR